MLVMRIRGKIEFLVMSSIVIAKYQCLRGIHVLVDIHESVYRCFHVYKLTQVKCRAIYEVKLAADESFIRAPLVIGDVRRRHKGTVLNDLANLMEIGLNSQTESPVRWPLFRRAVLASDIHPPTRPTRASLPTRRLRSDE